MYINNNTNMTITFQDEEIVRFTSIVRKLVDETQMKQIGFKRQQSITVTSKELEFLQDLQTKIKFE
jgi:hypothetical protein